MKADAKDLGYTENDGDIIVQGVIDVIFEDDKGVHILDYKSNYADEANIGALLDKYRHQLDFYEKAVTAITKKSVVGKHIYFLRTGMCYDLSSL